MFFKNVVTVFLFTLISSFTLGVNAKVSCINIFSDKRLLNTDKQKKWDENLYKSTFDLIYKYDQIPSSIQFQQKEVKLAFISALAKKSGIINQLNILRSDHIPVIRGPMGEYKARKFVETFLSLQRDNRNFLKRWLALGINKSKGKNINDYINQQMLLGELLNTLKENHLYRPNNIFENFKEILGQQSSNVKLVSAVFINYLSIKWFGFPMYLPQFELLKASPFKPNEFKNLKAMTHHQRVEYVKNNYSKKIMADSSLNFPRDAFYTFVTAYFIVYVFNPIQKVPTYITESAGSYYFSNVWVPEFYKEHGRYPDVFFNKNDQFLWGQRYRAIVEKFSTH